jgi:hypothetical protein
MAKPELPCPVGSSSSPQPSLPPFKRTKPPRSRRPYSSPGILALLATISASSVPTYAHPLDPPETSLPFLYPPFILQPKPTPFLAKRSVTPTTDIPTSTATPSPSPGCIPGHTRVPDEYAPGGDGLWYKTEWSLYGTSQCPVS